MSGILKSQMLCKSGCAPQGLGCRCGMCGILVGIYAGFKTLVLYTPLRGILAGKDNVSSGQTAIRVAKV